MLAANPRFLDRNSSLMENKLINWLLVSCRGKAALTWRAQAQQQATTSTASC